MKVTVVCMNDYPDCVFSEESEAVDYCLKQPKKNSQGKFQHWHYYTYEVDANKSTLGERDVSGEKDES